MFSFENDTMLVDDREDLIAVIRMRFGDVPGEMIEKIYEMDDVNQIQRLILACANASDWNVFLQEFQADNNSFRLVGEDFNPLGDILNERDGINGEEEK
jgi:hypothetical protein